MRVVVDTTVWTLALRRRPQNLSAVEKSLVREWSDLIREKGVVLLGLIRQEVLSGIRSETQFELLRARLAAFRDAPVDVHDYEEAARSFNRCGANGVTGSPADMLICAFSARRSYPILTTDDDFPRYAKYLPIRLHVPRALRR